MCDQDLDGSQWELSKENIQPIKQGRKTSILTTALNESQQKKLSIERQEFEKELRFYTGDDPLDVWYRYTLWVEQNYPKGGSDGNLAKLIESCFTALSSTGHSQNVYRNDERFLDLWIKFIKLCPCPLEVYLTLNAKNMFIELSSFFESWAWEIEKSGNLKKANAIYLEGIQRKAKPIDNLEMSYSKFQARVARLTFEGLISSENENTEADIERKAFSSLKPKGPKAKAPVERVATVIGIAGKMPSMAPKMNTAGPNFKIFQDENGGCNTFAPSVGENPSGEYFSSQAASSKENLKNPCKWNKNKMKQKTTCIVPVEDVHFNKPRFSVHADDCIDEPHLTPAKPTEFAGILSARKKGKDDWHVPLFIAEPFNPYAQPQYSKQLVYCGAEEFSFEELRALAWQREESKKIEEEKICSIKGELETLREKCKQQQGIISSLLQKRNKTKNSNEDVSEETSKPIGSGSIPSLVISDVEKVPEEKGLSASPKRIYEDSWVAINKSVSFAANATQNISNVLDESSTKALLALQPVIPERQEDSLFLPTYKSGPGSTPESPHSSNTSSKEYLTSPTVNTKFANNLIAEFFNRTLFHNSISSGDPRTSSSIDDKNIHLQSNQENSNTLSAPSVIYKDQPETSNDAKPLAPFPIYCDEDVPVSKPSKSLLSLPAYHNENEVPILKPSKPLVELHIFQDEIEAPISQPQPKFAICYDKNEEPPLSLPEAPFKIYSDVNEKLESPSPFAVSPNEVEPVRPMRTSDENQGKRSISVLTQSPSEHTDENKENMPPAGYEQKKKTTFSGVLTPSTEIPFVPLEQQRQEEENDASSEEIEGVEPLSESRVADDFTIKVPANSEAFAKMACVASTPRPWSFGIVPQATQEGDDFTMVGLIKSQTMGTINEDPKCKANETEKSCSSPKSSESPKEVPLSSNDEIGENNGDLMLPPSKSEVPENFATPQTTLEKGLSINVTNHTVKSHLSPIMETSRECRSSSSSSGSCTTFGTHSHFSASTHISHSTTGNFSKSINLSQNKGLSVCGENESYGVPYYQETSKSGYLADKSRGESMNEIPSKKAGSCLGVTHHHDKLDTSFDPSKVAAMLMEMDIGEAEPLNLSNEKPLANKEMIEKNSLTAKQTSKPPILREPIKYPRDIDPFCVVLQKKILMALRIPLEERGGFVSLKLKTPQIRAKSQIGLGKEMYRVKRLLGSGAYAQIFHASTIDPMNVTLLPPSSDDDDDGDEECQMILKVQKPACFWEFYICHELRERLKQTSASEDVLNSFMRINRGYFFPQNSILVSRYHKYGTLLDVVNGYKKCGKSMPENLVFFFMAKITESLIALHSCNIIHGDLKPDNVLLVNDENDYFSGPTSIKLIDFGRSIDMDVLPPGTTFTKKVTTEGFTCCEMRNNRPWTFQTDLYGLAAIAHCMLWGRYMNVRKEGNAWKLSGVNYYRYMERNFWLRFFNKMLNVPSCLEIPDLKEVLDDFSEVLDTSKNFELDIKTLSKILTHN